MALINKMLVGESLVGDGNEVAHIDLIMGPRGSAAELAFANALVNNKDGFTTLLAVVAPNLLCKPNTILFNKVTIKGARQAVQRFDVAQDPGELRDLAEADAPGTTSLLTNLRRWREEFARQSLRPGTAALDSATRENLEELGYVGD